MLTAQTRFQHFKHIPAPSRDLVAVDIFKRSALDAGNVLFVVSAQRVHLFSEYLHGVVAADVAHASGPDGTHRFQNVPFQRAASVAHQNDQALTTASVDALRNRHREIHERLPAAGRACFDIPAMIAVQQIFPLFLSQ